MGLSFPLIVFKSNQDMFTLMNSDREYRRTKHVELQQAKNKSSRNDIVLKYIETKLNLADGLTKGLVG